MKFYSFETMFTSLKDGLCTLCKTLGIYYELSDGRMYQSEPMIWHFEIKATKEQAQVINTWIAKRTIHERTV